MKTNGKRNREAGHNWEREIVSILKGIGYPYVSSSRRESRSRDDQKIDVVNTDESVNGRLPYNIQAKNVQGHLKYGLVLSEQPKLNGIINVIFHKQTERKNDRFVTKDKFAILYLEDFLQIMKERNERTTTRAELVPKAKGRDRKRLLPKSEGTATSGVQQPQDLSTTA